jgi:hypothetical protein
MPWPISACKLQGNGRGSCRFRCFRTSIFSRSRGVNVEKVYYIELFLGCKDAVVTSTNRSNCVRLLIQGRFVKHTINQLDKFSDGLRSMFIGQALPNVFFESLDIRDFHQMIGSNSGTIDIRTGFKHIVQQIQCKRLPY